MSVLVSSHKNRNSSLIWIVTILVPRMVPLLQGCRDGLPEVLEILNDTEIRRIADVAPCVKEAKQEAKQPAQQALQGAGGTAAGASSNRGKAESRPEAARGPGRPAVAATAVPCR